MTFCIDIRIDMCHALSMTNTERHLRLVPAPAPRKARKNPGDRFRTERAQDMFRDRWNAAQAKLAAQ